MIDLFAPTDHEAKTRSQAAWKALCDADTAWKATLPQITLAEYHAAQPTVCFDQDDYTEEEERYEQAFSEADFGLHLDQLGLETIAWSEWDEECQVYDVWGYTEDGDHERLIGSFPSDTVVYAMGLHS